MWKMWKTVENDHLDMVFDERFSCFWAGMAVCRLELILDTYPESGFRSGKVSSGVEKSWKSSFLFLTFSNGVFETP